MSSPLDLILPGIAQVRKYAERILHGIPANKFACKPDLNGTLVETIHPAFVIGHLSLYPYRISGLLDLKAEDVKPPAAYYELFSKDAVCRHDPELKIYPPMQELSEFYFFANDRILEVLKDVPAEAFYRENTEEKSNDRFPIVGGFVIYLLTVHANGHFGQLSVWRRCMGLGPA